MLETIFPYFIKASKITNSVKKSNHLPAWREFKINFSRPLFTIIFRPEIIFLDTDSILRVKTMYESVKQDVLRKSNQLTTTPQPQGLSYSSAKQLSLCLLSEQIVTTSFSHSSLGATGQRRIQTVERTALCPKKYSVTSKFYLLLKPWTSLFLLSHCLFV